MTEDKRTDGYRTFLKRANKTGRALQKSKLAFATALQSYPEIYNHPNMIKMAKMMGQDDETKAAKKIAKNLNKFQLNEKDHSLTWKGSYFLLSKRQWKVLNYMWRQFQRGRAEIKEHDFLEHVIKKPDVTRLRDYCFNDKVGKMLWNNLVVAGCKRGHRRLNLQLN